MRKFLAVSVVLALVVGGVGCGGTDEAEPGLEGLARGEATGELGRLVEHFRARGLEVADVHPKAYEMVDAANGIGMDVAGGAVEIYLFDPATADPATLANLERARTEGLWDMGGGFDVAAVVNGNILLLGLQMGMIEHPQRERVEEVFRSF